MSATSDQESRELHREFVGMLFALAIAQVAVRSGEIVISDSDLRITAPALSHLLLAGTVIATSWVGWGRSKYSFSPVIHPFTKDFVELALDVWLVAVYFFIVEGAERVNGTAAVQPSIRVEALWIVVMFCTYILWDLLTKWRKWKELAERGWASIVCASLAGWTFWSLRELQGTVPVVLGDLCLMMLVLLFRAMKIHNFSAHTRSSWVRIVVLAVAWFALTRFAPSAISP